MGIEPTLAAWEAAVLPLNYTRAGDVILRNGGALWQSWVGKCSVVLGWRSARSRVRAVRSLAAARGGPGRCRRFPIILLGSAYDPHPS